MTISLSSWQTSVWDNDKRFKVINVGRRSGKALALDTPILTVDGYKKLIDIKVGDTIFSSGGKQTKVTYKSEIYYGRDCYEVEFSNGEVIVADANHDWVVEDLKYRKNSARNKHKKCELSKLTTEEMSKNFKVDRLDGKFQANYSVPTQVIQTSYKDLPIEPYFLGLWLGDGDSRGAAITNCEPEVIKYLEEYSKRLGLSFTSIKGNRYRIAARTNKKETSLTSKLKNLGVLQNKHIPDQYLLASKEQRLELLAGLIDSDGYQGSKNSIEYCTIIKRFADDIVKLLSGLGIRSKSSEFDAKLYGRVISKRYRIHFTPQFNVSHIRRRSSFSVNKKLNRVYIHNIRRVASVPVQCLSVDDSSHLFLAGNTLIQTHNTVLSVLKIIDFVSNNKKSIAWMVSPTYKQTKAIAFEIFKEYLPQKLIEKTNETELTFTLTNGSKIFLKGGDNPDSLRGVRIDFCVFDETAFFNKWDDVWKVMRPTLADSKASVWFISCVVKDTLILGENGLEKIGTSPDGYSNEDKGLYGLGGFHRATQRYGSGLCPTKKIKTKFGFEIECTPNHKLWTLNGWKRSDEFKVGDGLLLQHNQQVFGNNIDISDFTYNKRKSKNDREIVINEDFAYLMGLFLAEGNHSSSYVDITSGDEEIHDFLINKSGFPFRISPNYDGDKFHYRCSSTKLSQFIDYLGIQHGAKNKTIPQKVLRWPKKLLKEFLSGYFDGDGFADQKRHRVGSTSSSIELTKQLQVLLLNFGVLTKRRSVITPPTKRASVPSVGHRLVAEGYAASVFFKEIGFRLSRKQRRKFSCRNNYRTPFFRSDFGVLNAKFGYLSRVKLITLDTLKEVLELCPNSKYSLDFIHDEIASIEDSENYVYDFVIPKTHSYFTNGLISHNTPNGMNHFKEMAESTDPDWAYFHYTTYDNPHIPREEIEAMKNDMDEDSFAQEILGEFRKMSGLIYKDFSRETHMVEVPHLDHTFTYTRSLDFGYAHKSALIYFAINSTGTEIYAYDGVYESGLTSKDLADAIKIKDAGRIITNPVADSAQPMNIEELSRDGIHFTPVTKGPDSVKNGISKVAELLKIRKDTGKPTLMFSKNLLWIADEFENYRWVETKITGILREVPLKKMDDAMDSIRYMAMSYKKDVQDESRNLAILRNKRVTNKWSLR